MTDHMKLPSREATILHITTVITSKESDSLKRTPVYHDSVPLSLTQYSS